jgi:dolichol-phosphate mannosyltransferase
MGYRTASIQIRHDKRYAGSTSYTFRKLLSLATDTIISHSDKPLKISIKFGLTISTLSFIYGVFIIYKAFFWNVPIMGWSSLIVSLYFLGGIIIFTLGILGIYLGKIFDEAKRRPLYLIDECIGSFTKMEIKKNDCPY